MPQHVSVIQQIGVGALAVASVAWAVGLVRAVRRERHAVAAWRAAQSAPDEGAGQSQGRRPGSFIPRQSVPATENVDLTPDERAAFAGLVRQLNGKRG